MSPLSNEKINKGWRGLRKRKEYTRYGNETGEFPKELKLEMPCALAAEPLAGYTRTPGPFVSVVTAMLFTTARKWDSLDAHQPMKESEKYVLRWWNAIRL